MSDEGSGRMSRPQRSVCRHCGAGIIKQFREAVWYHEESETVVCPADRTVAEPTMRTRAGLDVENSDGTPRYGVGKGTSVSMGSKR